MPRKKILISLEKGLREKIEKKIAPQGGKFSTFVEYLLKEYLRKKKWKRKEKVEI